MGGITRLHYQSVRNHFIKLLGSKCTVCGTTENIEIDHIKQNGWGNSRGRDRRMWDWFESYAQNNLQLLCKTHNLEKRYKEEN